MLQCLTKEALSGPTVSAFRHWNIDDVPILIHCPPQVMALFRLGDPAAGTFYLRPKCLYALDNCHVTEYG